MSKLTPQSVRQQQGNRPMDEVRDCVCITHGNHTSRPPPQGLGKGSSYTRCHPLSQEELQIDTQGLTKDRRVFDPQKCLPPVVRRKARREGRGGAGCWVWVEMIRRKALWGRAVLTEAAVSGPCSSG